jgi:hypothetical protein
MFFQNSLYLLTLALIILAIGAVLFSDRLSSKTAWAVAILSITAALTCLVIAQVFR